METKKLTNYPHNKAPTSYGIVTPTGNNIFLIGIDLSTPANNMIVHEIVQQAHNTSRTFLIEDNCDTYVQTTTLNCRPVDNCLKIVIRENSPILLADQILTHNYTSFVIVDIKTLEQVSYRLQHRGCLVRDTDIVDNEEIINDELYYSRFTMAGGLDESVSQATTPQYVIPTAFSVEELPSGHMSNFPSAAAFVAPMVTVTNENDYYTNTRMSLFQPTMVNAADEATDTNDAPDAIVANDTHDANESTDYGSCCVMS